MTSRPTPIGFWNGGEARPAGAKPYLAPEVQVGTTPLVKLDPDGRATRNFLNFHYSEIKESDFGRARALLDNQYKLVINGGQGTGKELFDVRADPAEKNNVIAAHPDIAAKMEQQLRAWQQSVLTSLTGADYRGN
jgi:arylsulfatase A-like enzyme